MVRICLAEVKLSLSEALFPCFADRKYRPNPVFIHLLSTNVLMLTVTFQGALYKALSLCCLSETQNSSGRWPLCDPWFTREEARLGGYTAKEGPSQD